MTILANITEKNWSLLRISLFTGKLIVENDKLKSYFSESRL